MAQPPEPLLLVMALYNFRALSAKENTRASLWLLGPCLLTEAAEGLKALLKGSLGNAHEHRHGLKRMSWIEFIPQLAVDGK